MSDLKVIVEQGIESGAFADFYKAMPIIESVTKPIEQELAQARATIARYEERERDTISDYSLQEECELIAQSIFDEAMDDLDAHETAEDKRDDMMDRVHEDVDGHQWVIYHYRAHQVCSCNTDLGEQFLEDIGMPSEVTYDSLATIIAFGEMKGRVEARIQELVDEWVDERGGEDDEEDDESDDEEHTLGTPEGHAEIVREEGEESDEDRDAREELESNELTRDDVPGTPPGHL